MKIKKIIIIVLKFKFSKETLPLLKIQVDTYQNLKLRVNTKLSMDVFQDMHSFKPWPDHEVWIAWLFTS